MDGGVLLKGEPLSATAVGNVPARRGDIAGHTASETKRVPATPVPAAPLAQSAVPGRAGAAAETPLTSASGSEAEPAWQRRHAALAAYLQTAEAAQFELQEQLEALSAEALFERASALERRALLLSCTEADELEHAGSVLVGAEPLQPSPSGAGGARRRGNKRKQRSVKAEAATGVAGSTPALREDA